MLALVGAGAPAPHKGAAGGTAAKETGGETPSVGIV